MRGRVEAATHERAKRKPTENMAAYEYVLTGKVLHHWSARDSNAEAIRMLDKAIELDPKYAHAHAWKACVTGQAWLHGWAEDAEVAVKTIADELQIALSLDDNDSDVHRILAALNLNFNEHDKAVYHQERALSLNPNSDLIVVQQGEVLTWLGRPLEGHRVDPKAMRLNPYHPERFWSHLGRAQFTAQAYADAIQSYSRINDAGSKPPRVHGGRFGAHGQRHCGERACAGSARPSARLHRHGVSRDAPLPPRPGPRALPRGSVEGWPASLIVRIPRDG